MYKFIWSSLLSIFIISTNVTLADFPIVDDIKVAQALSESTGQHLLVIFGAESCNGCVHLKQDIHNGYFLMELDGKIVCYIDVSKHKNFIKEFKINTIPDSRLFIDGKQTTSIIGYQRIQYQQWLIDSK